MDAAKRGVALLEREPRLAELVRCSNERLERVSDEDPDLPTFVADARSLLGHERAPDPVASWAVKLSSGDLALRRTLEVGKLLLRRWEARLVLFRQPVGGLERVLGHVFERPVALTSSERWDEETELSVLRLSGAFERALVLREGRELLIRLSPTLHAEAKEQAHEPRNVATDRARRRPPGPASVPCTIKLPPGGRYPKRSLPRKKRATR
jgi:hypothetical protein